MSSFVKLKGNGMSGREEFQHKGILMYFYITNKGENILMSTQLEKTLKT